MTRDSTHQQFVTPPPATLFCGRCRIEFEVLAGTVSARCPKCWGRVDD